MLLLRCLLSVEHSPTMYSVIVRFIDYIGVGRSDFCGPLSSSEFVRPKVVTVVPRGVLLWSSRQTSTVSYTRHAESYIACIGRYTLVSAANICS